MSVTDGGSPGGTGGAAATPADPDAGLPAERLLLFTDAVVAISITLLILPLVDLVPEAAAGHEHAREVVTGHLAQIGSFLLSFAVVATFWREHHRLFSRVGTLDHRLVMWNIGWLLTVVVMPFPTEMVGAFGREQFAAALYYLNLLASLACQAAMLEALRRRPDRLADRSDAARGRIAKAAVDARLNVAAVLLGLVLALVLPVLQYWSLLLLAVVPRAAQLLARVRNGRP